MISSRRGLPPPAIPEMQVLGNQNHTHVDRQHDVPILYDHEFGNPPFYDINASDHVLWSAQERIWNLDDFVASHDAINNFVHLYQEKQHPQPPPLPPVDGASSNDCHHVFDYHVPLGEWPQALSLDTAFDKFKTPAASLDATLYPPTAQTGLAPLPAMLQPSKNIKWNNRSLSPLSPRDAEESPTNQKKRNRNRLAAAKCRRKAKRGVDELQQRERDLLRENKMLSAQACALREEVLQLKTEILRHKKCDNDFISQYIRRSSTQSGVGPSENSTCNSTPSCTEF
ncbi:hypothetical protein F5B22DRAFT_294119 [Xylaria bambusicola]|uniref:uncharacterized protein n=1 Tax=Xylaria bambusicola TaxID=326684 RepID=UPI002007A9EA|nr:uncharacterized protein F5B22DRAFT_294119 [Xylaria bambusicola]KAI0512805.1 hypothetical protein F5B22DRAFT_294119 [Xylaria bambusicola]